MPKIQCTTTYKGRQMTVYGVCPKFEPGDHNEAMVDYVTIGPLKVRAEQLTPQAYDELCEILSLNAELQPD